MWTDSAVTGVLIEIICMQDDVLPGMMKGRYSSYSEGVGKRIRNGEVRDVFNSCPGTWCHAPILRPL